jgi:uncharacterized membrane protein YoaK (UPF0700 family)
MMSTLTRTFFEAMLTANPVFVTFIGAGAALVLPASARRSFMPALRFGVVVFIASLVGTASGGAAGVIVQFLVALVATGVLWHLGELREEWYGMPQTVLVLPLLMGAQLAAAHQPDLGHALALTGGLASGFSGAFILVGSIRETARLSESPELYKTNPVVLFSMAVFALICSGFLFW